MENFAVGLLATLGIGAIIVTLISVLFSLITIVGAIILLCLSIKEKKGLKVNPLDESRIQKIVNISVFSLVICVISCSGWGIMVLPILSLIFSNSNAKQALRSGNIDEALKKSDLALLLVIISNSVILGLCALNFIISILQTILNVMNNL